jgi:hypothetical protein
MEQETFPKVDINEKHFKENVFNLLNKEFEIDKEVTGIHFSGKKLKIDAIIKPRVKNHWKNQEVVFGIEFKSPDKIKSTHDVTHWISQCVDYANCTWGDYKYIYILSCPGVFENYSGSLIKEGKWFIDRVISDMGVGQLMLHYKYGWCIYLQTHLIWSENRGVISGKTWALKRKFGSK